MNYKNGYLITKITSIMKINNHDITKKKVNSAHRNGNREFPGLIRAKS